MKIVRKSVKFVKRVRNRLSSYYNLIRLKMYGVEYGRHCVIHGKLYINLFSTARVKIGDNLYFSSGWGINALCANKRGMIYATENARITIGNNVGMSSTVLWAHESITIGDHVKIGGNSILIDTDSHNMDYLVRRGQYTDWGVSKPIVIEDDVFIGVNCIILKGVTIGARSIIAAGSVVTKSIPADCVAGGNPAKVIKSLV
ncbi:MAG: acyltransferase [Phocaeicola sp.]|nr:acyltransferase [Phocaeicola sp.]